MSKKTITVPGRLHNVAVDEHGNQEPLTGADEIMDDALGKMQSQINAEQIEKNGQTERSLANRYTKKEVEQMVTPPNPDYKIYDTYAEMVAETDHPAGAIYRVSSYDGTQVNAACYSEYTWNGSVYKLLAVKSQVDEVFDISTYNNNTYDDLLDALGESGSNVPESVRRGGMSVKYVQTSDNKYVQFRYMSDSTAVADFTNVANWQGVDDKPVAGSRNLVESGGVFLFNEYPCYNLIDPFKCLLKRFISQTSNEIKEAASYKYAVCCVKAPVEGLISHTNASSFSTFLVVKKDGSTRKISGNTYTYDANDDYLYIQIYADLTEPTEDVLIQYIKENCMAVKGTSLPNVFIPYGITESVYNKFSQVLSSINNSIDKLEFDSSLNRSYQGFNAINPETIIYNSLINNNTISIGTATSKNALAVIRAPREGIIVNCSRTDVNTTSPFAVVKEDGTVRYYSFTGEAVNKYTYQDEDKYLYIYIFDNTASTNDDMYQYVKSFVMGLIGEEELPTYHVPYDYTKEDCKRLHDLEYESYILKSRHRAENVGLLMAEDGSVNTSKTSYRVTDAISLVGFDKITFQGIWSSPGIYAGLVLYNENDEVVHVINNISTGELYLNAYPTAVSVRVSGYYENTIYVSLFKKQSELKIKSRIIIVDCKGYGDYTSIDDAIAAANDSNDNQITIIVKPGTYTTKGERTDQRAPEYQHPYDMNYRNLTIIGTDRERCILRNDIGIYDTHAYDDSVLRLCGNVTIKNLTLISTHNDYDQSVEGSDRLSAYCLHLDKPVNSGDVCVVDNCTMISENGPCIGSGLKNGLTIIVRNCSAKLTHHRNADEYYTWHGVFYFHGWNDAVAGQSANLEVKNCVLENVLDPKAININGLSANDQINYLLAFNIAKTSNTQNSVTTANNVVKSELSFGNNVESMNYTV